MALMRNRFRRFFASPVFDDEEKTRTARILNTFGWSAIAALLLLMGAWLPGWEEMRLSTKLILPLLILILLGAQALLRLGYVRGAAIFAVALTWAATLWQASQADGIRDVALISHLAIVLLAALLLGWREGLFVGVASVAALWYFAFQEQRGVQRFNLDSPFDFARDLTAVFVVSSVLIYLLIHHLNRSLSDAQTELRERLRSDEKLRAQTRYLTALHQTALDLLNRLEIHPLLESILDRASELLDTPHAVIDLLTEDRSALRQELGKGAFSAFNGAITKKGTGLVGKVWEHGKTISIQDYSQYPHRVGEAERAGFGAVLGTPLKSGPNVVGTLVVGYTDKHRHFTQEQAALLERFAALASLAIDNARLYEQAQKEIGERSAVEKDLRSSEERFRKVFNNNNIAIAIVTLEEGVFLEANEAFWRLSGLTPKKALGHSSLEFDLWKDPQERADFVKELLAKGSLQNVEVEFPGGQRERRVSIGYYELIQIKEQRCILCMFYDVTEQKRAQDALRNAEARTRAILAAIPDMIFEVSKDGVFLDYMASSGMTPLLPPAQFLGRSMEELMPPAVAAQGRFALERAIASGQIQAFEYSLPSGGENRHFEARICAATPESAIVMVRDISQRKWVETEREKLIHELEERNAESEALRESMAILVETLDETRAINLILEQLEKVIAYNSASVQLLRGDVLEIVSMRGPDPLEEHIGMKFKVNENEPSYPILTGQVPYLLFEDVQAVSPAFQDGLHSRIHAWLAIPLKAKGQIIGIIALDGYSPAQFTEKHAKLAVMYANQVAIALENARLFGELQVELAERKKLIEELEVKNAELERFTYTASHDLKSPLITIKGFLGFLEKDAASGNVERMKADLQRIADATDKMQSLLNDLLDLSRVGWLAAAPQSVPFGEIVREAAEMVNGRLQAHGVEIRIQENLPIVFGQRQRLVEVLQNLIDNAAKFSQPASKPMIEVGQEGYENDKPIFFVRDNGIGIDPAHHERIFGLFNKLDAGSEGSGVGLALVKRIIEVHGGRIWVRSEAGGGSTFFFTLPTQSEI